MRKLILLLLVFVLSSCHKGNNQYNGYIDADLVYLSSDSPGRLSELLVKRGQWVEKNKLLFKLEQTSEINGVKSSVYNVDSLRAQRKQIVDQLNYDAINYRRTLRMRKGDAASQNDLDVAKKELDVLKSQLTAMDFQIKSSQVDTETKQWIVGQKTNNAPDSGIIFDTYYTQDEFVQAGQPVLSLITKANIKAVFFVPEADLSKLVMNANVVIHSDANPHLAKGSIQYIANIAQYTPPIIYSREERQKLVFRVEARITSPDLQQLHLGQPVTMELVQ